MKLRTILLSGLLGGLSFGYAQINTGTNTLSTNGSAVGLSNNVNGDWSLAGGTTNFILGDQSFALGDRNSINANYSFATGRSNSVGSIISGAFGINNKISGPFSYAFGQNNLASSSGCFAFGKNTAATAINSFVFGYDPNIATPFTNSTAFSFLVGFSAKAPGFMVMHSPNVGPLVGVATDAPLDRLDVRLGDKQIIRVQPEVANTHSAISFRHSDGTENWRFRSYSDFPGGYDNLFEISSHSGGDLWINVEKTLIGGFFDFGSCSDCADFKLFVRKGIRTERVKVDVASGVWADYVFDQDYDLKPLSEVEAYIETNKHLPGVPSSEEMEQQGLDVAKSDALLLQKIEELTLYMIKMEKKLEEQEALIKELQNKSE